MYVLPAICRNNLSVHWYYITAGSSCYSKLTHGAAFAGIVGFFFKLWCGSMSTFHKFLSNHDDVIKWRHFPRYWPFVRGIHRSPVNSPHKGQWCGALMFTLICARINGWENNREAGDLRRYRTHYDVIVMLIIHPCPNFNGYGLNHMAWIRNCIQ